MFRPVRSPIKRCAPRGCSFSATVFKSDPKTTPTMQWQERNPGRLRGKDVRNATSFDTDRA